jgi:integrative and conjugative element protein (TIGR02256 family)
MSKVDVVAQLASAASGGAMAVQGIVANATDTSSEPVGQALKAAQLVVDASAGLGYPRYCAQLDDVGRHVSVFLTPDGNGAVLMAEDQTRSIRLRTLEAQYYRALVRKPWGEHHLEGSLATFWSGASCRDISVALPYSRVLAHAATLGEQVVATCGRQAAQIRVWQRDPNSGAVAVHDVQAMAERKFELGDFPVFIDEGVIADLRAARQQALPAETGGVLLGYVDFNVKAIVIVDALAAPPDSKGTRSWFERGTEGLAAAVAEAARRTAGIVGYVGEWHSHPAGHDAAPSGHDLIQLAELAMLMHEDGLPVLQLIVGDNDDLRIMRGEVRP